MKNELFVALQRITPQHLLSRCAGLLASSEVPLVKNTFIRLFHDAYQPDMSQAVEEDPLQYRSFNAFFSRAIKPDARPIDPDPAAIVSPSDGFVSQVGDIDEGRIFQAKGHEYSVQELLACDSATAFQFHDGRFMTIYLTPSDYHRVHMPFAGTLIRMTHVPGRLFSVNTATTEAVPRLFARNERLVCHFDTDFGPMAMAMVGALLVSGVETVWSGEEIPAYGKRITRKDYRGRGIVLERFAEMARFNYGSTVIVLLPQGVAELSPGLCAEAAVRLGQRLARRTR